MKRRVEAGDIGNARDGPRDRFDQRDFPRQVLRVEGGDPPQPVEHLRCDQSWLDESVAPVDNAVPDGRDRREPRISPDLLDRQPGGRGLVWRLDLAILRVLMAALVAEDQPGAIQPDPLDAPREDPRERVGRGEDRELQA